MGRESGTWEWDVGVGRHVGLGSGTWGRDVGVGRGSGTWEGEWPQVAARGQGGVGAVAEVIMFEVKQGSERGRRGRGRRVVGGGNKNRLVSLPKTSCPVVDGCGRFC